MGTGTVVKTEGGGTTEGGHTPFALPWPQLCLPPNLSPTVRQGSANPVFLGQLFSTRFTFLLVSFLPSRAVPSFCFLFCYKMGFP